MVGLVMQAKLLGKIMVVWDSAYEIILNQWLLESQGIVKHSETMFNC